MARTRTRPYDRILRSVCSGINKLEVASQFPLAGIAKAIEQSLEGVLRITFMPVPKTRIGDMYPALTLAQPLRTIAPGQKKSMKVVEIFIFWARDLEPDHEMFVVAHELGHIYLHHRAFRRVGVSQEYVCIPLVSGQAAYAIRFTPTQEKEADLFAVMIMQQHMVPARGASRLAFHPPCIRFVSELADRNWLTSDLADILPKRTHSCILAESLPNPRG